MNDMKNTLTLLAKLLIATGIIYWLFQKGQIDFTLIPRSLNYKLHWATYFALIITAVLISNLRWRSILHLKSSQSLPIFATLKMTWIGLFFNSMLPGAVSGDLVKVFYARKLDHVFSNSFLLTSVFIDRIFGLLGLLILAGIFGVINYHEVAGISPEIKLLLHTNFLLCAGAATFLGTLFIPDRYQNKIKELIEKIPFIGTKINKIFIQLWLIGKSKKTVFTCILMGMAGQSLLITGFWMLTIPFCDTPISLLNAFIFMPVGFITIAIPITPAGLGVGHAIFNTLFAYFGVNGGASLFNLYFIGMLFVNLLGAIPYIAGPAHRGDMKLPQ